MAPVVASLIAFNWATVIVLDTTTSTSALISIVVASNTVWISVAVPVIVVTSVVVTVPVVNPSMILRSAAATEAEVTIISIEPVT